MQPMNSFVFVWFMLRSTGWHHAAIIDCYDYLAGAANNSSTSKTKVVGSGLSCRTEKNGCPEMVTAGQYPASYILLCLPAA